MGWRCRIGDEAFERATLEQDPSLFKGAAHDEAHIGTHHGSDHDQEHEKPTPNHHPPEREATHYPAGESHRVRRTPS